ncbi:unnamed protein product [Brachionus calyciflorus]|uniref:ATP-dependent RNA helicase n=1 Tax=Brachionus calyciflorus TaxID=104777 RepID=A0A813RDA1_9BILA|nr:unnamed protein product [Brachionus calyciflorus]
MSNQDTLDDDFMQLNTSTVSFKEKKAKKVQQQAQKPKKTIETKEEKKVFKKDDLKKKFNNDKNDNVKSERPNKFKNDRANSSSVSTQSSKTAKFSSLFKNNHEIPKVGDIEAKETVKETIFSSNKFSKMDLHPHLVDCLEKRFKLNKMTQIQEKSIPAILDGKDCFLKSQTGSGKTLAYSIPVVQQLMTREPKIKRTDGIRALILVPTRELALQTCQVFEELCKSCIWLVPGCLIGGMKKKSEKDRIRRGLNILIATPGRLCDHLDTTLALDLSKLEYLIFDEADRMLDLDFEKKINFIIFKIHSARKKVLAEPEIPKFKLDENGEPIEDDSAQSNLGKSKRLEPQIILISATLTSGIKEIARRLNVSDALQINAANDSNEHSREDSLENEEENAEEKIALPAGLSHFYTIVPSKLRLVSLISFILEKFAYNKKSKASKMVIFASTNDSVQFHDNILTTFLNRKFNMYLDEEDKVDYEDINEFDSDIEEELRKTNKTNSSQLENSIKNKKNTICDVFSLYGNMDQHKRAEILGQFCKAKSGVLICTDVAARGLDMPNIDWIIQYNTPGSSVDYVHRVGRTARVGHKGSGLIYIEPCEVEYLKELNKLGISMQEIKIDSIMKSLMEESNYYPRQVNSDRLVYPKNVEECANSMQFYMEEYVEKISEVQTLARKAYISFMRSYSTYSIELKKIFHIKNLHLGHVAKSFGLREAPNEIIQKESKLFHSNNYNRKDDRKDKLGSKHARDLKRISNGHKEYGNVTKKNKQNSQRTNLDLSGLLKNHKQISEYSSGFEKNSNNKRPRSSMMPTTGSQSGSKSENELELMFTNFNTCKNALQKISKKISNLALRDLLILISILIITITPSENCSVFKKDSKIRIRKNGYSNIIIAIDKNVPEDTKLIENIKEAFTEASEFLFYVTNKRAYFRDVTIVVPSTWSLENYFDDFNSESSDSRLLDSTWESYDRADICIENRDSMTIDIPFVVNYAAQCGQTASNINFSPNFFLNRNRSEKLYGQISKVVIHYWSQYRYGVFPEYPHKTLGNNQEFYLNVKGEIEATRCSLNITGKIKNPTSENGKCDTFLPNGLPSIDCVFEEDPDNSYFSSASVLNKPSILNVNQYCDNTTKKVEFLHNRLAPTIQNIECKGQSIWEVLRKHPDFSNFNNMPNDGINSLRPKFQILKNRFKKVVLLIDRSIEQLHQSKLKTLKNVFSDFVKEMIDKNTMIGVVHFDKIARIASKMTYLNNLEDRKQLIDRITPKKSTGLRSNIWNGIILALSLLRSTLDPNDLITPSSGNIILISSSDLDSNYPNMNTVLEQIKSNEITIDSIRLSEYNDQFMENTIIKKTDGVSFMINKDESLVSLQTALGYISNRERSHKEKFSEIANNLYEYEGTKLNDEILIDDTIANNPNTILKLVFNFENLNNNNLEVIVYEPSGKQHESYLNLKCKDSSLEDVEQVDSRSKNYICKFNKPNQGAWKFQIDSAVNNFYHLNFRAFVYVNNNNNNNDVEDLISSNYGYYDLDEKKRRLRESESLLHNEIKVEAKWLQLVLNEPSMQILFLSLSLGNKPIVNASVKATIYRPIGDSFNLQLYDDGLNADRFQNDGVYSRYFSNFNSDGKYFAKIEIATNKDSRVCLQKIIGSHGYEHFPNIGIVNKINQEDLYQPIKNVQRLLNLQPFELKNFKENKDLIPPSKIRDLIAEKFDFKNDYIQFRFTAPGDDFDLGRSLKYEINLAYDPIDLLNEETNDKLLPFNILASSFVDIPNQSGFPETFILSIKDYEAETISIRIRAIDSNRNKGEWSNVLTIKLNDQIKFSPQLTNVLSFIKNDLKSSEQHFKVLEEKENFYANFFICVIVSLAIIFMVQIMLIIFLTIRKISDLNKNIRNNKIKPVHSTNGLRQIPRAHDFTIERQLVKNCAQRHNFFTNRVSSLWNGLPKEALLSKTTNEFKNKIDKLDFESYYNV